MSDEREKSEKREFDPGKMLSGTLNLFGLKIDMEELLGSPERLTGRLEELRERLKEAGGKETLSDEEWSQGGAVITGHFRTRGLLGEHEYHVGTTGRPRARGKPAPESPQVVEPPIDLFEDGEEVTIIADVPGVRLEDLELKVEGGVFSLSTRTSARRSYRKELPLEAEVVPESLHAACNNGVLEVRLRKREKRTGLS